MPDGFTEDERAAIRERLLAAGRERFARYGRSKTTVSELTDEAGIADGTFYRFFDSKLDLYAAVLEREGEEILPDLLAPLEEEDDPETALAAFMRRVCGEIETNPLVERLLTDREELDRLRDHYGPEGVAAEREQSLAYFLPYVEAWYEAEAVHGPDPETVASAVRAVTFVTLHRRDIGEELYEPTRDLLIDAVARGLTTTAN
ncbi:TetR/AcrR family transcriptional regulator [Halobaculum sp. MBLA0143]|uniref:TetR/AcrR family transcriptional regulator n=1 Tax=Halobaculum sp. MBLA0143 TaxID=3079933 RepID=UPI003525FC09